MMQGLQTDVSTLTPLTPSHYPYIVAQCATRKLNLDSIAVLVTQ